MPWPDHTLPGRAAAVRHWYRARTVEQARLQPYFTGEYAKRVRDDMTLRYYYEGSYVASRRTPQGVEVLAVGWDEVRKFLKETPPDPQQGS